MMNRVNIIYGSSAIKHWFNDYSHKPKDVDVLTTDPNIVGDTHWDNRLEEMCRRNGINEFLVPDLQLTLLISHTPWETYNGKWWKYLKDIHFLQNKDANVHFDLLDELHDLWSDVHHSKHRIKLTATEEVFFSDYTNRKMGHDQLHELINPTPAFHLFKRDDSVGFCPDKWMRGNHHDKVQTAIEESLVIALERNLTCFDGFKHLVTQCSKGNYNLFCIINSLEILNGISEQRHRFATIRKMLQAM